MKISNEVILHILYTIYKTFFKNICSHLIISESESTLREFDKS